MPAFPGPPKRLITIVEVAEWLDVSVRHVRRLVHERRIPFIKWGGLLRFDSVEIEEWIDTNRREVGLSSGRRAPRRQSATVRSATRRRSAQTAPPEVPPITAAPQLQFPEVS
ncbi:MAG: helix-turn-helix domain-containing protein [Acidimicrobiales bacterium]